MSDPSNTDDAYTIKRTLGFLVFRSQRLMNQQLEAVFQQHGLTVHQFVALRLVLEGYAKVPSDIAKTLGLDTGGATRLVDQLEEKGLMMRKREASDRRLVSIALTPEGVERACVTRTASTAFFDSLLTDMPAQEREAFVVHLELLVRRLEAGST